MWASAVLFLVEWIIAPAVAVLDTIPCVLRARMSARVWVRGRQRIRVNWNSSTRHRPNNSGGCFACWCVHAAVWLTEREQVLILGGGGKCGVELLWLPLSLSLACPPAPICASSFICYHQKLKSCRRTCWAALIAISLSRSLRTNLIFKSQLCPFHHLARWLSACWWNNQKSKPQLCQSPRRRKGIIYNNGFRLLTAGKRRLLSRGFCY